MAEDKITEEEERLFDDVINDITSGMSVRKSLLNRFTVRRFYAILDGDSAKVERYARACDIRAEVIFDEMFDIADDSSNDYMTKLINSEEVEVLNSENIQRSRLRIDTRKWALAKMKPKKYGDKIDVTSGGEKIEPVAISFTEFNNNNTEQ